MLNLICLFLVSFIYLSKCQISQIEENTIPVFQPYPSAVVNPLINCKQGQTTYIKPFTLNSKSYIAISLQLCGLHIYETTDVNQVKNVFSERFNSIGKTLMLSLSHNQRYLWAGLSTGEFFAINIGSFPFQIELRAISNNNLQVNQVFSTLFDNDILILLCANEMQIYDWRNKIVGLKYMKSININAIQATQIEFFKQNQFALVTTPDKGVQLYQTFINNSDPSDIQFTLLCLIKPHPSFDVNNFNIIDETTISIMMSCRGLFMYSIANILSNNGSACTSSSFTFIARQQKTVGKGGQSYISNDRKFIYTGMQVDGIKIFDISKQSYSIVQSISDQVSARDIVLNENQDTIFFTNSQSLLIFKRTQPNFNRNIPNLLLNAYQNIKYDWFKEKSDRIDFECIWQESKNLLFVVESFNGVEVLKYSGSGILEPKSFVYNQDQTIYSSKLTFLEDGVRAYLTRSQNGLSVIDFSNPDSPLILNENILLKQQFANFSFIKFIKGFTLGLVANQINLLIISIKDPVNPVLLNTVNSFDYTLGDTSLNKFELSLDENIVFLVHNSLGVVVVDISNPNNPVFKSKFYTDGASDIRITQDQKYVIIAANYKGIIIASINSDFTLSLVSETKLFGLSYKLLLMNNDKHALVVSYEYPTITYVNLENMNRPIIMQRIEKSNAFGYFSMCLSSDNSELFVTSLFTLNHLQLKTEMIIHTQIYQLISKEVSNEYIRQIVEKDVSLKVGQQIEIHLAPIYQYKEILIQQAFYYSNYVLNNLPPWMQFSPNDKILSLNISKQSLKKDENGNYIESVQQIVFLTYQQIESDAFIQSYLGITASDSLTLYNACVKEGYINQLGFIDQSYSPNNEINLGFNESTYLSKWSGFKQQLVKDYIKNVMNMNIINYTISFKTVNSLNIDLNNKSKIISSIISEVSLNLKVSKTQNKEITEMLSIINPKFVKTNYQGVLVLFSEIQDEIKIEGTIDNINKILQSGIRFYLDQKVSVIQDLQIDIKISDSINYDYENTLPISQIQFLDKKVPIQLSTSQSLQNEINQRYSGGKLYIQESFYYQVGEDIFISSEGDRLDYSVKMFIDGEFKELPKNYWLSFSSTDRIFSGIPTPKYFYESVKIQVNATDGYTSMVDTFEIIPVNVPFSYVIQLAIQILGPIFGILGFYKYKKDYTYSPDIIYVGEVYQKQLTITDNVRPLAQKLWIYFQRKIGQNSLKSQLFDEINKQNQITSYNFFQQQYFKPQQSITESKIMNENLKFHDQLKKKMFPYSLSPENIQINAKFKRSSSHVLKTIDLESKEILNRSTTSPKHNQQDPNTENCSYDQIKQDNFTTENRYETKNSNLNNIFTKSATTLNIKFIKNILSSLRSSVTKIQNQNKLEVINTSSPNIISQRTERKNLFQSPPSVVIFSRNGEINFESILQYVKEQQCQLPPQKRILNDDDLEQLNNQYSLLSQGFYCFLIEYLVNEDVVTKNLLEWMQSTAMKYYNKIDWYKAYLNINPQIQDIKTNHYSQFTINQNTFTTCLRDIFQTLGKYYYYPVTRIPKPINIQLKLLEEGIKIQAIGFSSIPPGYLKVTQGESLHCYQYQINSIRQYEKNHNVTCCLNLKKKLDLDYIEKSLSDNEKLPSWIHSIDLINGIILMKGVPEMKDVGTVVLKIIDNNQYVLRQCEIIILEKETEYDQSKQAIQFQKEGTSLQQGTNFDAIQNKQPMIRPKMFSSFASRDYYQTNSQTRISKSRINSFQPQKYGNEDQPEVSDEGLQQPVVNEEKSPNLKVTSNFDNYSQGRQVKQNQTFMLSNFESDKFKMTPNNISQSEDGQPIIQFK